MMGQRIFVTVEPEEVFVDFGLSRIGPEDGRPWTLHLFRWSARLRRNRDWKKS